MRNVPVNNLINLRKKRRMLVLEEREKIEREYIKLLSQLIEDTENLKIPLRINYLKNAKNIYYYVDARRPKNDDQVPKYFTNDNYETLKNVNSNSETKDSIESNELKLPPIKRSLNLVNSKNNLSIGAFDFGISNKENFLKNDPFNLTLIYSEREYLKLPPTYETDHLTHSENIISRNSMISRASRHEVDDIDIKNLMEIFHKIHESIDLVRPLSTKSLEKIDLIMNSGMNEKHIDELKFPPVYKSFDLIRPLSTKSLKNEELEFDLYMNALINKDSDTLKLPRIRESHESYTQTKQSKNVSFADDLNINSNNGRNVLPPIKRHDFLKKK